MSDLFVSMQGRVSRVTPSITPDGQPGEPRLDRDRTQFMLPVLTAAQAGAADGEYFVAATPTPGTAIVGTSTTGTSYSDTQAILGVNNRSPASTPKDIIIDFLYLHTVTAGASLTSEQVASRLDRGMRASAATTLTGYGAGNGGQDAVADIHAGVITVVGATNEVRNLGRAVMRVSAAPASVIDDEYWFKFGATEGFAGPSADHTLATIASIKIPMPAVVIPPGWSWILNEWAPARATTAISWEYVLGYWVR